MTQKQPLVIGNWKNALSVAESVRLVQSLTSELVGTVRAEVVIAPSMLALTSVVEAVGESSIAVAAQTIGAYEVCTGEVQAVHMQEAGATYAIIGHSERRQQLGETDDDVAAQVQAAAQAELIPIVCVGETKAERKAGRTKTVLRRQITKAVGKFKANTALVIAYEPVWAIGAKKPAPAKMIREAHEIIRAALHRSARIVYGGSIDTDSAIELAREPLVDGFLVGRASLDASRFHAIIQAYEERV